MIKKPKQRSIIFVIFVIIQTGSVNGVQERITNKSSLVRIAPLSVHQVEKINNFNNPVKGYKLQTCTISNDACMLQTETEKFIKCFIVFLVLQLNSRLRRVLMDVLLLQKRR